MEEPVIQKEVKRIDKFINYVVYHSWVKTGVFIVAFLEATLLPILPEIVVGAILAYRKDISWKLLSLISALGSAAGVSVLYLVGKHLYAAHRHFFEHWFGKMTLFSYAQTLLDNNTFVSIFIAGFTPLPDRIFALLAGIFGVSFAVTVVAFFLGRLLRVGIVAYFSYKFGDEARHYILKHTRYFTITLLVLISLYILLKLNGIL
jgi:membrane protein YqaA with SNARE-associated domain